MTDEKKKPKYEIDEEAEAYAQATYPEDIAGQQHIAKEAYKAGAMATLEYAKEAMLQNVASFNRQCIIDFMKDLANEKDLKFEDYGFNWATFLKKWGLSDEQIHDIGLGIEK